MCGEAGEAGEAVTAAAVAATAAASLGGKNCTRARCKILTQLPHNAPFFFHTTVT